MAVTEPDIWKFDQYREYLLAWKAAGGRKRSFQWIGKALGTAPAHVHAMLNAQPPVNIEGGWTDCWVRILPLDETEKAYFRALVSKELGATPGFRRTAADAARILRRTHDAVPLEPDDLPLVANWEYAATYALGRLPGFRGTPDEVAALLLPRITPEHAREVLEFLFARRHFERDADGSVRAKDINVVVTDPDQRRDAMRRWYSWFMHRGPEAMEEFPAAVRHFGSAMVLLPQSRHAAAVKIVEDAKKALLALDGGAEGEEHRAYAVTLQLFPVSDRAPG